MEDWRRPNQDQTKLPITEKWRHKGENKNNDGAFCENI